jgi:hypothetical protein
MATDKPTHGSGSRQTHAEPSRSPQPRPAERSERPPERNREDEEHIRPDEERTIKQAEQRPTPTDRHPTQPAPVQPGVHQPDQQPQRPEEEKEKPEEKVLDKEEAKQLFFAGHRLKRHGDPAEKWIGAARVHGTMCICRPLDETAERDLEQQLVLVTD